MSEIDTYHVPIMRDEVIDALRIERGKLYLDCTLGGGGHTQAMTDAGGRVVAIDRDSCALEYCKAHRTGDITYIKGQYENAVKLLAEAGISSVAGALMDLGVSSRQLDDPERGFAYRLDGPLDMRMDTEAELTAEQVVNEYSESELIDVLRKYGEESFAKRIVSAIVRERGKKRITTTGELSKIVCDNTPYRKSGHPAKKTFQAIRIEVNGELKGLYDAICDVFGLIERGGRLCVISFHSLEDRIVKAAFNEFATDCICPKSFPVCVCNHRAIGKTIARIKPSQDELTLNPRATSATLRVIEKL